jgi:hypothetical protein
VVKYLLGEVALPYKAVLVLIAWRGRIGIVRGVLVVAELRVIAFMLFMMKAGL